MAGKEEEGGREREGVVAGLEGGESCGVDGDGEGKGSEAC